MYYFERKYILMHSKDCSIMQCGVAAVGNLLGYHYEKQIGRVWFRYLFI